MYYQTNKVANITNNAHYILYIQTVIGDEMEKSLITNVEQLNHLNDKEVAIEKGPNSATGKRKAYENLLVQQKLTNGGQCNFTMFNLFTSYRASAATTQDKSKLKSPPLLKVDDGGTIILTKNTRKFIVQDTVYTRYRRDCVINQCPYVPLNDSDERSCYSTLLLHTIWPIEGEINVLHGSETAVECLRRLKVQNEIPQYVKSAVESIQNSHVLRSNTGSRENNCESDNDNNDDENDDAINEDLNDDNVDVSDQQTGDHNSSNTGIEPSNVTDGKHIISNITARFNEYYANFIRNSQEDYINKMKAENQINSSDEISNSSLFHTNITRVNNYNSRLAQLENNVKLLTRKQLQAYNTAAEYINGSKGRQMIMFVTGEGGTGKSFLIKLIMEYANIIHGKQKGLYGSAVALAPTGAAAKVIDGHTWQAVYGKGIAKSKQQNGKRMAPRTAKAVGAKILGIKLAVLDEISMINLETLYEISERQKQAMLAYVEDKTEREYIKSTPFGGVHMLFTGDFYQLRPVTGEAIYRNPKKFSSKEGQKIWFAINEYIELTESTRFKDDETPYMNQFLSGARKGKVNQTLLNKMNERVMTTFASAKKQAGPDAVWISHNNREVNKFNDDDYKDKVKNGACHFRIQAFHTPTTQLIGRPDENKNKELLKIHVENGIPPYLNLAIGTRVSCTKNLGTQIGEYA
jgi:DNA replication protein DnaC